MNDTELLSKLSELIDKGKELSGKYDKIALLKKYPELKELLILMYDPLINFYVTGRSVEKYYGENVTVEMKSTGTFVANRNIYNVIYKLIGLLGVLQERKITGEEALLDCATYLFYHEEYFDTLLRVFDRDLGIGISVTTINAAFPDLITEFNVPLARTYTPEKINIDDSNKYWLSRKLDGIRCLCFITRHDVKFYSRNGKEFFTLDKIKKDILHNWKGPYDTILDGELCIYSDGVEDFQAISREYRKKDHTIEHPLLMVFDSYSIDEFKVGYSLSDYEFLNYARLIVVSKLTYVEPLEQTLVNSVNDIMSYKTPLHWEGLMLRKDDPPVFARSNNLLKVKKFKDIDLEVTGITIGKISMLNIKTDCVTSLTVEYKGYLVDVGSGLTWDQRILWKNSPRLIVGKTITVKYFNESRNKDGGISLRFPIFKGVREDGE